MQHLRRETPKRLASLGTLLQSLTINKKKQKVDGKKETLMSTSAI